MAVTTLPSSLPSSRGAAAAAAAGASRAGCVSSRRRLNPIRVESSATASKESKGPRSSNGDELSSKRRRAGERDASSGTDPTSAAAASRARINPTRIEIESSAAKEPKRPRSCHGDEPLAKRRRAGETDASSGPGSTRMMSAAEKDDINRLLISLLPPGCSPHQVNPLPDCVVSVLQENGVRRGGGADAGEEEIEVDVYALGDEALRAIKDVVGAYVEGRAPMQCKEEAPSHNKEGVARLSGSRSILSRTTPRNTPSRAALKRSTMPTSLFVPEAAPMSDPFKAPFMRTPPRPVSKSIPPRSVPTSIPSTAEFNSIPPPTKSNSIPLPVKSNSIPLTAKTAVNNSIIPLPVKSNSIPLAAKTAVSNSIIPLPAKTAISQSLQRSATPTAWSIPETASSSLPALPKPLFNAESLSELLYAANKGCEKAVARHREIEKLRAAARKEIELMVRTVEFNDPYIDYTDVFK